jgi:gamma-tubulin complex component 5
MRHRHRRKGRRGRARKPDVIGFAESLPHPEVDSDSGDSDYDDDGGAEPSVLDSSFVSLGEDNFFGRLERMSLELDGLVRFVRRGVDSLAAGTGDASVTFGILAFCLEDWEL